MKLKDSRITGIMIDQMHGVGIPEDLNTWLNL